MVKPGPAAFVLLRRQIGRLLDDDIGPTQVPTAPGGPVLILHSISEFTEQPTPFGLGAGQVRHPQLHMMQLTGVSLGLAHRIIVPQPRISTLGASIGVIHSFEIAAAECRSSGLRSTT
jgi:hypothetical protein